MRLDSIFKSKLSTLAPLSVVLLLPFLTSGNDAPTRVEQVERRGSLTMLTRNGASSYFLGADGDTGPEYELVSAFASFIGVDVEVRVADAFSQLAGLLQDGQGDLIAANLTRTPSRESQFRFGPDYDQAHTEVVYRRGTQRPESIEDLVGLNVAVIAGTSYEEILQRASTEVPALEYEALEDVGMEDLLLAVSEGHIDATLVDSNILKINRHFYPSLRRGFTLEQTQPQAWAFVSDDDDSLVQQARMFMTGARETGLLTSIQDQFFNRRNNLDQVG
ncbi:MAG: transporter substrate-binding domain-containing protein, partial [Gammaproteobacteria bacterium]|nr:transporter substrate-binding domain-containing protein [Gammaproteobacteria bacterium]